MMVIIVDKNAIKSFAIESRRQMIGSVKYQASLIGITSEGIIEPVSKADGMETYDYGAGTYSIFDDDIRKRESLVREVKNKGFDNVIEEVAYTWFNRIIAIRYMEVNDYLPTRTRVLSSETEGKIEPDIITDALDLDLDYTIEDKELILKLKDENKLDELFRLLFVKQSNKLNEILPGLFERTDDYMELLLNISFTDENGVIRNLINSISEEDFGNQVEIIGWLYQFYNTELKDETFANLKKRIKISKERIPAATQLFTPDWIVKYMVENSIGRLWLEGHPNNELKSKWKYFVDEAEQDQDVKLKLMEIRNESKNLKPEDLKIIDPCMGSGHILVYVFDVLMQIYSLEGYTEKDAAELILKYNIYGLDIDDRAYQLAYFAVMMKARKYNRSIFSKNILPLIFSIQESNNLSKDFCNELISLDKSIDEDLSYIISVFNNAKEYGCILNIKHLNFDKLFEVMDKFKMTKENLSNEIYNSELNLLRRLVYQSLILSNEFDSVITNPPYMSNRGMEPNLHGYLKKYYPNSKSDLSTVFFEKSFTLSKKYGFVAMINIPVWMFISSYDNLRKDLINKKRFINMLHLGRGIFGSDFGTTSFVINNSFIEGYKSTFRQLYVDKGAVDSVAQKESWFFDDNFNKFIINQDQFKSIPGNPIAYWISNNFIENYNKFDCLGNIMDIKQGLATGNNKQFLRYWFEVEFDKIGFKYNSIDEFHKSLKKYAPYNKGGEFKKWYGNCEFVIKFDKENYDILSNQGNHLPSKQYYFKDGITWTLVSSKSSFAARISNEGFVFDVGGSSGFTNQSIYPFLGFLCSNVAYEYLSVLNPTINVQVGDLKNLPFSGNIINDNLINLVKENVDISKRNWDLYEVSWNFNNHPFLEYNSNKLKDIFIEHQKSMQDDFELIKNNEEQINKLIIDYYSLNEISHKVEDKDITLKLSNYEDDVKSFISYVVGCIFGRYSLDKEGLQFAGGDFNLNEYYKFVPDDDNIIPILDTEYFKDDIVGRFVYFVKICFGEINLEENLDFIANALNKKGKTSREIIRNYFLTDFFKDHIKTYNKCPIYWQFDSGKQNAFKCLIYMHRYDSSIIARVRTDYLHKTQKAIEQNLVRCDNIVNNSTNKSEVSKATKDKSKYIKQLDEIKVYDEALRHMATQNIEIDLDDGVKDNYKKFQKVEISIEGEKPKKINLLKNI